LPPAPPAQDDQLPIARKFLAELAAARRHLPSEFMELRRQQHRSRSEGSEGGQAGGLTPTEPW